MYTDKSIYDWIIEEEASFKTVRVPITTNVDWNMHEHIERCTNVANGWYHTGGNDGTRPYKDIVSPIINVAMRSEGFDVKDIVPFVNDSRYFYKSFLIKKYHPQWARKYEIDTFIDELVESSVIYDLALVKNVNKERPEVVPLQSIAFCDQTDVLSGPLCLKHQYSEAELLEFKGKWNDADIEMAIAGAKYSKPVSSANDREAKTPGKYIEVYELHGVFPNSWLDDKLNTDLYDVNDTSPQMHIVAYYRGEDGHKVGLTLFKGMEKNPIFDRIVLRPVFGRACGKSTVESLFEDQVWTNYSGIQLKEMLDAAAIVLFHTDDEEIANQKLTNVKKNKILKLQQGRSFGRTDTHVPNITAFQNEIVARENNARILGSVSEGSLGINPSSGTPFRLENLIVQQGMGIHEYRQGKIATFMSDRLYKNWILPQIVKEMNGGKQFSEELSTEELAEIAEAITNNEIERRIKRMILATGKVPSNAEREVMRQTFKENFMKGGNRRFFEILQDELKGLPTDVYVNIAAKQKYLAQQADKIANLVTAVMKNPLIFAQFPGIGKMFNQLIEASGMNPVDFSAVIKPEELKEAAVETAPKEELAVA